MARASIRSASPPSRDRNEREDGDEGEKEEKGEEESKEEVDQLPLRDGILRRCRARPKMSVLGKFRSVGISIQVYRVVEWQATRSKMHTHTHKTSLSVVQVSECTTSAEIEKAFGENSKKSCAERARQQMKRGIEWRA